MDLMHGFELIEARTIPELNTRARWFRHVKSGAQMLSLENDDENKVFMVAFRTPPENGNGVAHIMEHSVLGGAQKIPAERAVYRAGQGLAEHVPECVHLSG